ncbi:hypothetical protein QE152_g27602 [Popillia japonica]|uniref:Uncharacterized protein n=1 Tax=Popillia japonica TaxID=7064 RepID=A0AAW1JUK6_POPJA
MLKIKVVKVLLMYNPEITAPTVTAYVSIKYQLKTKVKVTRIIAPVLRKLRQNPKHRTVAVKQLVSRVVSAQEEILPPVLKAVPTQVIHKNKKLKRAIRQKPHVKACKMYSQRIDLMITSKQELLFLFLQMKTKLQ